MASQEPTKLDGRKRPRSRRQAYGLTAEGRLPDFQDLHLEIKKAGVQVFRNVAFRGGELIGLEEAFEYAAGVRGLDLIEDGGVGIWAEGCLFLAKELYAAYGKKLSRQQVFRLNKYITEITGYEMPLEDMWHTKAAAIFLGSIACSALGSRANTRPHLPLAGVLVMTWYQDLLFPALNPDDTAEQITEQAAACFPAKKSKSIPAKAA